jgi:hypothetical protein
MPSDRGLVGHGRGGEFFVVEAACYRQRQRGDADAKEPSRGDWVPGQRPPDELVHRSPAERCRVEPPESADHADPLALTGGDNDVDLNNVRRQPRNTSRDTQPNADDHLQRLAQVVLAIVQ